MEDIEGNNKCTLGGKIISECKFSHEVYEEKFYKFFIEIERFSNLNDVLPVIISERIIDINELKLNSFVLLQGEYRSYNKVTGNRNKLMLNVFVKDIEVRSKEECNKINELKLEGFICKNPKYRMTPLGREISDVLIAVNRSYRKSDYIPCILWGRNAKFSKSLKIGTKVKLVGRIQSREYEKKINEENIVKNVAYEVSVSKFSVCSEESTF